MASNRPVARELEEDEIQKLLIACGIERGEGDQSPNITSLYEMNLDGEVNTTDSIIHQTAFQKNLANKIRELNGQAGTVRFIVNTRALPDSRDAHWAVLEISVNENNQINHFHWADSLEGQDVTINETYCPFVASALFKASNDVIKITGLPIPSSFEISTPQTDSKSCGVCAVVNYISKTTPETPASTDTSVSAQFRRVAKDRALNPSERMARLWEICDPILSPSVSTGKKAAFIPIEISFERIPGSAKKQAYAIIDHIVTQALDGREKIGLTYSANKAQTEAINKYNQTHHPNDYIAMKATFATANNQGNVIKEILDFLDTPSTDENVKKAQDILKQKFYILPITTIDYGNSDHSKTTDQRLDDDLDKIYEFASIGGCILGWQNQNTTRDGKFVAIGGGVSETAGKPPTFTAAQSNHVQTQLQKLHAALQKDAPIPARSKLVKTAAAAAAPAPTPTTTTASAASATTIPASTVKQDIEAAFNEIEENDTTRLGSTISRATDKGADEETLGLLADHHHSSSNLASQLEQKFYDLLDKVKEQDQESVSRALIASINQYAELKFSERDKTKLVDLETRITALRQTLQENNETLSELKTTHLGKISAGRQKKCAADIDKRLNLPSVKTALDYAGKFDAAKPIVEGWLEATILERSKAVSCVSQAEAMTKVANILGSTASTPNSIPRLTSGDDKEISVGGKPTISVFDLSVTVNNQSIRSATVRTVDLATQTVKSEFHFLPGELEKFKNRKNTDAEMMKMIAQNVLNQSSSSNKTMRLNPGDPPMPKSMIEGYIIYYAFKGINFEAPPGYRQFQEDVKKPGWFGRDSMHDSFAKSWKISNPEDVGIEEQRRLEAVTTPRMGR